MKVALRREILRIPTDDGGLDLFDLLYDRIEHLSAEEVAGLEAGDLEVLNRLEALVLLEGEHAETLRRQRYDRHRAEVVAHRGPQLAEVDWSLAAGWPKWVSPLWRDPEQLRRLAESRAAGNRFLSLPGFVNPDAAQALYGEVTALEYERMDTPWVRGARHQVAPESALKAWTSLITSEMTRTLFGAVLGRRLDAHLTANIWRLGPGDGMPVHADGRRYQATISLGLSRAWSAAQGGAIAIGSPSEDRFDAQQRWLPHLGDVLLFAPEIDTWHAVEPVISGTRYSVTSWWTGP